jgi:rhodanese-related sulfurtransferase
MTRRHYRRNSNSSERRRLGLNLARPPVQIAVLILAGVIIFLLAINGNGIGTTREANADQAFELFQQGAVILDVRTQAEWDQYHAPNSVFIPIDQLPARLNEIPRERQIIVVCSSAQCSELGRDTLLSGGFTQVTSMTSSMQEWYLKGYPIEGAPPQ